ncbi:MAG: hypothetical protein LBF09_06700 [Odoribacteraceae bacterium]|nr:hypothetical protein [Odoribacteraceae bacterium]
MKHHRLQGAGTVARYSTRLLTRDNLFRLLSVAIIAWIAWFHVAMQSDLITSHYAHLGMSSTLPHANACLFSLLILLPLVACTGRVISRVQRADTVAPLDARPGSNAARVAGAAWGIARVCLWLAAASAASAAIIHLTSTTVTFRVEEYLFYLLTLTLPSIIFLVGLSLLVNSVIAHKGIACATLLAVAGALAACFNDDRLDLVDPLGLALPNALSRVTGHPDLAAYLAQRAGWLAGGAALVGLTALLQRRLTGSSKERAWTRGVTAALAIAFLAGAGYPLAERWQRADARRQFIETHDKYRDHDKLSMTAQTVRFETDGARVKGRGTLQATNPGEREITPVILYLNPGLRVDQLRVQGENIPFKRDRQVIIIPSTIPPGATLEIDAEYSGKIDERACYLDITDESILSTARRANKTGCRYGNRHAYAGDRYTLLLPEASWYPTTRPPANPGTPFADERDFTRYTLLVTPPAGKLVISQGKREERADTVAFHPEHPLDGITLCAGNYTRATVTLADSTTCELYLHRPTNQAREAREILADTIRGLLQQFKQTLETSLGRYPFNRFMIIEAPVALASYYRPARGGSEYIQPEIAFLPETVADGLLQNFKQQRPDLARARNSEIAARFHVPTDREALARHVTNRLTGNFTTRALTYHANSGSTIEDYLKRRAWNRQKIAMNPHDIAPLFRQHRGWINAPAYPGLNLLLDATTDRQANSGIEHGRRAGDILLLNNYLARHGLAEALDTLHATTLFHDLLLLQSGEFTDRLFLAGITPAQWHRFYIHFRERHDFRAVTLDTLREELRAATGIDIEQPLRELYRAKTPPAYLFGQCRVERLADDDEEPAAMNRYRLHWDVMNDSDTRGVISLVVTHALNDGRAWHQQSFTGQLFEIGPREARRLTVTTTRPALGIEAIADTRVSRNVPFLARADLPANLFTPASLATMPVTRDTAPASPLIDTAPFRVKTDTSETIADNDGPGFSIRRRPGLLSRGKEITPAYNDRYTAPGQDNRQWTRVGGYGHATGPARSTVTRHTGSGREEATWRARIHKAGTHEILAYIPGSKQEAQRIIANKRAAYLAKNKGKDPAEFTYRLPALHQYYTVTRDGGETTVAITNDTDEHAWISLGKYRLSPGEHLVKLHDKRDHPDQHLHADAVKWIYTDPE